MKVSEKVQNAAERTLNDPRWQRVLSRDESADGMFVYSVKTTGVYCRPSCPARPARPENVQFHASIADAKGAGFRACKRCKPDGLRRDSEYSELVTAACRIIEARDQVPKLRDLAAKIGMSEFHFHRVFKSITGLTPRQYAAAHRANRVRAHLEKDGTVTNAILDAGYGSSSRFYEQAEGVLGMTPSHFRSGGTGQDIRFAVGECSLGSVLVASSNKGICAILLGDDPDALARDLQDQFPKANLIGGDQAFESLVATVVGLIEEPTQRLELPLDIRGTAFQQRVWKALREIPPKSTVCYAQIAARIGAPTAVRAVAQACGANRLAVAIPCHRVVRNDGGLSGYRWGVERKQALLNREAGL
jgi:AraC family transcriptional regulator of adaptative response/methylated-DNA-[protein]-cysteine methyltransferase